MLSRALTVQNTPQSLSITLDRASFFVDEYIQGKVELNSSTQLVINDISISFQILENWLSKGDDGHAISDMYNECLLTMNLDIKRKLNINANLISLNPGKYIFPFYFKIPKVVQACFEYPTTESKASIRYSLTAQLLSPYAQGTASTYVLLKSRPILQNKQLFFTNSTSTHKWGLFSGGSTTLNISILNGTDNFRNGENINFNIDIDNSKGKIGAEECKITLSRIIKLKSKFGKVVKEIKNDCCLSQKFATQVAINERKNFNVSLSLMNMDTKIFNFKEVNIPYINITDMSYFLPSINSYLLECDYNLKATLYFTNFVKHDERPRIIIPIRICHQSLPEYNSEVQNYLARQNSNNNNQYFVNQNNPGVNLNRSLSLMNNQQNPLSLDNNENNEENYNDDLPTQEEVEKPNQNNNNMGAPSFGAPMPAFQTRP
jgi:hypothetical protein